MEKKQLAAPLHLEFSPIGFLLEYLFKHFDQKVLADLPDVMGMDSGPKED